MSTDAQRGWHPWHEMRRLQHEMERLFGDGGMGFGFGFGREFPPVNVTRDEKGILIEVLCPGTDRQSIEVTVIGDAVSIRGERKPEPDVSDDRYHKRERPVGTFNRTVRLGERLDPERALATYKDGILVMRVARAADASARRITIQG